MSHPVPSHRYVYKQRNRHKFHVFMTVITCGVWGVTVWPAMIAWNYFRSGRKAIEPRVD